MQGNALRIFVVEKDSFIARDMQIGLQQACPGGDVHCLRSLKDLRPVLDVLPPSSALPVFITRLALQRLRESGLDLFSQRIGGVIVSRGDVIPPDEITQNDFLHLPDPFSTDDLYDLAAQLTVRSQARPVATGTDQE